MSQEINMSQLEGLPFYEKFPTLQQFIKDFRKYRSDGKYYTDDAIKHLYLQLFKEHVDKREENEVKTESTKYVLLNDVIDTIVNLTSHFELIESRGPSTYNENGFKITDWSRHLIDREELLNAIDRLEVKNINESKDDNTLDEIKNKLDNILKLSKELNLPIITGEQKPVDGTLKLFICNVCGKDNIDGRIGEIINKYNAESEHKRIIDADELLKRISEKSKIPSLSEDTFNGLCEATAIIYDMLNESEDKE